MALKKVLAVLLAAYIGWYVYARYFSPLYSGAVCRDRVIHHVNAIKAADRQENASYVLQLISESEPYLEWCWQTKGWFKAGWIAGPDHKGNAWTGGYYCKQLTEWWITYQQRLRSRDLSL